MLLSTINEQSEFCRVHHGFLNDKEKLLALTTHINKYGYIEIAEGDVCWIEDNNEIIPFMMHPLSFNRLPDINFIKKGLKSGEIITLSEILEKEFGNILYIFELKTGIGDRYKSLEKIVDLLETKVKGRYWIDSFSPSLLSIIKELSLDIPTSLHTRLGVYGKYVIETAFESPYLKFLDIYNLNQVDAITVTYKYCPARFLRKTGCSINKIHKHVMDSNKKLIFGGIGNHDTFEYVKKSCAIGAYLKFDKEKFAITYEN